MTRAADHAALPSRSDGALDRDLRAALQHLTDALSVTFEPQVDLATGRLVGLEALVQWRHPELGLLDATELLGAERDPALVVAVAEHVLVRSLSQLAAWRTLPSRSGLHLVVNVTGAELRQAGRVATVIDLLDAIGLPTKALVLGVLEDVLLDDEATHALRWFADAGVRIALAEFGTGASSLDHLRLLPVSMVKIDRSFVAGLGTRSRDEAIVRAVTHLCADLGAECVAAGVDAAEPLAWLRAYGVPLAQGSALHGPLAAPALTELLRHVG